MKTKCKFIFRTFNQLFGGTICAGVVLLLAANAPAQNMFVSQWKENVILEITPEGVVTNFASGMDNPFGLAFDTSGNLYSADAGNSTVSEITPSGNVSQFASGFNNDASLAFDSNGN